MTDAPEIEWPREIWMIEREDDDQLVVTAVLSAIIHPSSTPAFCEKDDGSEREFHRYVDGDIFDSLDRYCKSERDRLTAENARLRAVIAGVHWAVDRMLEGGTEE